MPYSAQRVEYSERQDNHHKVDPVALMAAKQVYRYYLDAYTQLPRPLGVAVNRVDMSGKLIYTQLVLLPQESFVPITMIESSDYR